MTGPLQGPAQGGQSALHLGVSQPDPQGVGAEHLLAWHSRLHRDTAPQPPAAEPPSAAPPPAQLGRALCAGSDGHTWCSH